MISRFDADTVEKCEKALKIIEDAPIVAVDTETNLIDLGKEHPIGRLFCASIQFSVSPESAIFVPLCDNPKLLNIFKGWLTSEKRTKVLHNAKFDMHVLMNHGIRMRGLLGDTEVLSFMYQSDERTGLKPTIQRHFGDSTAISFEDEFRVPYMKKDGTPSKSRTILLSSEEALRKCPEKFKEYASKDAAYTVMLYNFLVEKLKGIRWMGGKDYLYCYEKYERPFTDVLFEMERRGCLVDFGGLSQSKKYIREDIHNITREIFDLARECGVDEAVFNDMNLDSSVQLGELFRDHLKLDNLPVTEAGRVATDIDTIKELCVKMEDPRTRSLITNLLERRHVKKLEAVIGSFVDLAMKYGGRIHSSFRQTGTRTARLASRAPNLQNVPRMDNDAYGIRKCFVAPQGMVLCDTDLSQIELRITAHVVKDSIMLKAIRDGWDLHSLTAIKTQPEVTSWFVREGRSTSLDTLKEVKKLFPEARNRAKTLNFGVIYGMGEERYMQSAKVSKKDAAKAISGLFATYPGLRPGIEKMQKYCLDRGYVKTYLGRYLQVPGIWSDDTAIASKANRQAFNYMIQGSAADLLKMGMLLIEEDKRLKELGVRMVLQVHDELLFEVPKGAEREAGPIILDYVSHPYNYFGTKQLLVDTPAEIGFGSSWSEAK